MNKKPTKGEYLGVLLRSPKTIFSIKDAALLWGEEREQRVSIRLNKYAEAGKLIRLRRGFYAKDKNYDKDELATKIYTPSYVSFETVLGRTGITFQYYGQIFAASYLTRKIVINNQTYSYRKIKESVLTNNCGIKNESNYSIATAERAFLDVIYLNKDYYFDNLSVLDWNKVMDILPIYSNKRMEKEVGDYIKIYDVKYSRS